MNHISAIILAAGKGKRMNSKNFNKVSLPLKNKPMILYAIDLLSRLKINPVVVVVGFAKRSVIELLENREIIFAEQKKRLGTAHAVTCGLRKIPGNVSDVLVFNGDDSAFYSEEVVNKLISHHISSNSSLTFLTVDVENPTGLGRVVRDEEGKVVKIVEEKDANENEKNIREINPACYFFKLSFLKKYLKKVPKSNVTGEYYLTHLIDIAIENKQKIDAVRGGLIPWRGVNTKEELAEAEKMFINYEGKL